MTTATTLAGYIIGHAGVYALCRWHDRRRRAHNRRTIGDMQGSCLNASTWAAQQRGTP